MHPADINAALIKRGYTQTRIAELVGATQAFVSNVVHNRTKSRPVANAIAAAIDKPVNEIWPGVYEGEVRPGRPRAVA